MKSGYPTGLAPARAVRRPHWELTALPRPVTCGPPTFTMRNLNTTRHIQRFAAVFVLVAATIAITGVAAGEEETIREAREKREDAAERVAEAAEALELVEAEDSEVAGALRALDTVVALQEARIAEARQAIEAAEAEATLRWVEADRVATEIEDLRGRLRELALSLIHI